jgi:hypothetical protein
MHHAKQGCWQLTFAPVFSHVFKRPLSVCGLNCEVVLWPLFWLKALCWFEAFPEVTLAKLLGVEKVNCQHVARVLNGGFAADSYKSV